MILRSKVSKVRANQKIVEDRHQSQNMQQDATSSKYFSSKNLSPPKPLQSPSTVQKNTSFVENSSFLTKIVDISNNMNQCLNNSMSLINKSPVKYIYNPTEYAFQPYKIYLEKYCRSKKKILFVGMNPGPFGMCQTGIPFGDPFRVKNWLNIYCNVEKPPVECPARPIQGFESQRKEVSGDRLWKLFEEICETPDFFFRNAFVYNYCPLAFMDSSGKNLTPAELKHCNELESICDEHYLEVIDLLQPQFIVAIGTYIEKRTICALKGQSNRTHKILRMPHPSPRAPNNQNWNDKAKLFLKNTNLLEILLG